MNLSEYKLIPSDRLDDVIKQLERAQRYCNDATSVDYNDDDQEPTMTYPGASGYAAGTIFMALLELKYAINGSDIS